MPMSDKYNADLMLRVEELRHAYDQMYKAICRYNSPNKDKALEKLRFIVLRRIVRLQFRAARVVGGGGKKRRAADERQFFENHNLRLAVRSFVRFNGGRHAGAARADHENVGKVA